MPTSNEMKRLQMQQEAQAAAIARMQMQMKTNSRQKQDDDDEEDDMSRFQGGQRGHQAPQGQQGQQNFQATATPRYEGAGDPNQAMLEAIVQHAATRAAQTVQQNQQDNSGVEASVKKRMERLVEDYPALRQEDSDLVTKSRQIYSRITQENPGLDDATKYELAVREAASVLGARPISAPVEDYATGDFVMPVSRNPARPTRSTKSRLTPEIIANARLMGINVDPNNAEGKKNLAELSEYSSRFNADVNEDQFKYR